MSDAADVKETGEQIAERLVRGFEGCVLHPYQDIGGVWTIGYGCTVYDGGPVSAETQPMTQVEADAQLMHDLQWAFGDVDAYVTSAINPNEFAALASFVFNVGPRAFQTSTLLRLLNGGDRAGAARQFARWNLVRGVPSAGLSRRRAEEAALFLKPMAA